MNKLKGIYADNWFGRVTLYSRNEKFYFRSKRSSQLCGEVVSYQKDTLLIKWNKRNLQADAQIILDKDGKEFTLHKALPETSSAFDFEDLHFVKRPH